MNRFCIVALALVASATTASAQAPGAAALREACGKDIKQFCADVQPGGGRIVKCLQDNESKLSQACKDARAAMRSQIERGNRAPAKPE